MADFEEHALIFSITFLCFRLIYLHSRLRPTYLRRSRRLQLLTCGVLMVPVQWVPGVSAMDRRGTQIGAKFKSNWHSF